MWPSSGTSDRVSSQSEKESGTGSPRNLWPAQFYSGPWVVSDPLYPSPQPQWQETAQVTTRPRGTEGNQSSGCGVLRKTSVSPNVPAPGAVNRGHPAEFSVRAPGRRGSGLQAQQGIFSAKTIRHRKRFFLNRSSSVKLTETNLIEELFSGGVWLDGEL